MCVCEGETVRGVDCASMCFTSRSVTDEIFFLDKSVKMRGGHKGELAKKQVRVARCSATC